MTSLWAWWTSNIGRWWHPVSTEETVCVGRWNVWAVIESVLAVCVYWYVALFYDTHELLYWSIFIAPILFLRSEKSINLGVKIFSSGMVSLKIQRSIKNAYIIKIMFFIMILSLLLMILSLINVIGKIIDDIIDVDSLIWIFFISGILIPIFYLFRFFCFGPYNMINKNNYYYLTILVSIIVLIISIYKLDNFDIIRGFSYMISLFWIAVFCLVLNIYSVFVRFLATCRYIPEGIEAMPVNITRLFSATTPFHVPELVPGLQPENSFRFKNVIHGGLSSIAHGKLVERILGLVKLIVLPVWFIPSWAYRFILKSTLWLWWILLFIGGKPVVADGLAGLAADDAKRWNKAMVVAAMAYLCVFCLLNVAPAGLRGSLGESPILPIAQVLFLVRDIGAVPWVQLAALGSALLTIALWFMASDIKQDRLVEGRAEQIIFKLELFARLARLKSGLGLISLILLIVYLALMLNKSWAFLPPSEQAQGILEWIYGNYAKALLFQP